MKKGNFSSCISTLVYNYQSTWLFFGISNNIKLWAYISLITIILKDGDVRPFTKHLVIYDAKNEHLASKESCIIIKNGRFFSSKW